MDDTDQAQTLFDALAVDFSHDQQVHAKADTLRWRLRRRLVAPAEEVLSEIARRPHRDDPEAAMARLADLSMDEPPEDLARRVFGLWSNACARVVLQRARPCLP